MPERRIAVVVFAALLLVIPSAIDAASTRGSASVPAPSPHARTTSLSRLADTATGSLEHSVFDMALGAATCAIKTGKVANPQTLTVIDYSKPSSQKRLWVFDLSSGQMLFEELVAHGKGSGDDRPTLFSNEAETHQSSIGLFVTDTTYSGANGYSLRLDGLDAGVNDHARDRAIVVHGAPYVSDAFIKAHGRLGRSWGCPAIRPEAAREIIDRIKGGNLVFAYYPDEDWMKTSKFLGDCGQQTHAESQNH
jgi:hypothetical protein